MQAIETTSAPTPGPLGPHTGQLGPPRPPRNERRAVHGDGRYLASRLAGDLVGRVLASGPTGDRAIADLAAAQCGLVTRRQLTALGLGVGAIDHRLRTGRLHRLHRGVYAVGHTALVPLARELAGVLTCGPDAVLSHHSAAALWGLRPDDPGDVHVTIGRGGSQSRPGLRVHRTRSLDAHDIRLRRGIPVTSPPRTIIDLADVLTERDLARTANEAEIRGLARRPELIAAVERSGPGRRGCALLREILRQNDPPTLTRSEAEERLLALITDAGLPRPEVNVRIQGHEVDALWRSSRLVVEVDGYAFHSTRAAFERDRARDGDLQAAGLRVLRVTWRHIVDAPYAVIARIAQALARASVATAATHPHAAPGRPRLRPSPR